MEFPFDLNNLFGEDITLVDSRLKPCGVGNYRELQQQMSSVLDKMGDASAKAQGLHGAITGGHRLSISDHHLFVMKDAEANSGKGAVVGILKTGRKKLFIYDREGGHHEMEPMCVLDFYVHESRQRQGCGKKLFEHMLREEGLKPQHLAVDRPSPKFLSFLSKHYHLKQSIPQVNNFVVFESFFRERGGDRRLANGRPPAHPYRRQGSTVSADTAASPSRYPSSGTHGSPTRQETYSQLQREKEALSGIRPSSRENYTNGPERPNSGQNINWRNGQRALEQSSRAGLSAHQNMYSRHAMNATPPPPPAGPGLADAKERNAGPEIEVLERVGKQTVRDASPPIMRRRDGPSKDYIKLMHPNDYQDRRGHLKVSPLTTAQASSTETESNETPVKNTRNAFGEGARGNTKQPATNVKNPPTNLPPGNPYETTSAKPKDISTGWNIFGVPTREVSAGSRRFQQTRLW